MLAVVFSAAFGTVLAAAEDIIPSELSDKQKQVLKYAFCEKMGCHVNKVLLYREAAVCGGVECDGMACFERIEYKIKKKKWSFLIEEMSHRLNWSQVNSEPYVQAFLKDLEISFALDDFRFTADHALNCIADLRQMFEDNYTPTFNIELLK